MNRKVLAAYQGGVILHFHSLIVSQNGRELFQRSDQFSRSACQGIRFRMGQGQRLIKHIEYRQRKTSGYCPGYSHQQFMTVLGNFDDQFDGIAHFFAGLGNGYLNAFRQETVQQGPPRFWPLRPTECSRNARGACCDQLSNGRRRHARSCRTPDG